MNLSKQLARLLAAVAGFYGCGVAAQAAPDGVMTFPHVNVVALEAGPSRTVGPPAGFMAYKDPVTGRLGDPTAEQSAALNALPRAATPIAKPRAGLMQMRIVRPPHGGLSVMLDESHDRYAVARKTPDGGVTETCEPAGDAK
jgi:hypothetical protein